MKDSFSKLMDVDSRIAVMINDLHASRDKSGGRVAESSFKRIPSVKSFKVKVGMDNELLHGTGLERKLPADFNYIMFKEQNRVNRYMEVRIKAMRAVLKRQRPDIFWAMVQNEMKHSVCFRTSAFNAVFPGWYKNLDFQRVVQINFGVEHILKNNLKEIKYFRVEIPKGKPEEIAEWFKNYPDQVWPGKMRPLGVPTAAWRVVLHMWNGFLTLFLEEELKEFNHAYMPKVGTITAIKDFITKVRHKKFIYEFDIKGFFNNVSIFGVCQQLRDRGLPEPLNNTLFHLLKSAPANIDWSEKSGIKTSYDADLANRKAYISKTGAVNKYDTHLFQDESQTVNPEWSWLYSIVNPQSMKGLPQGAAPSTILSILALADWYKELKAKGIGLLMYADDGLLFSDEEFEPSPPQGFQFAEEKCKWARGKENSEELKFLGIKYNFESGLIKGSTRNGSTLEFGFSQLNFLELLKKITPNMYGEDLMGTLARSNIFGLALSKLYGGKFGKLEYAEDVKYNAKSYWSRYHNLKELQESKTLQKTASTTACGWLLLLNTHVMAHIDRDKFYEEAKSYHTLRPWEITASEILAAMKEQAPWDKPDWFPHQGSAD